VLVHTLYPMLSRDATAPAGAVIALAGRTRMTGTLTPSAATNVAVKLEWSPTGNTADWTTLTTIATATGAPASKTSIPPTTGNPDFTIPPAARYLRAEMDPTTGVAQSCQFDVAGSFFDPANVASDKAMLTKDLQNFELLSMLADRAEGDVLEELLVRVNGMMADMTGLYVDGFTRGWSTDLYRSPSDLFASAMRTVFGESLLPDVVPGTRPDLIETFRDQARPPVFDLDLAQPGAGDAIRREVVTQLEHLFRREKLSRSDVPAAHKTLRELTILAPGLCGRLLKRRESVAQTWRGR